MADWSALIIVGLALLFSAIAKASHSSAIAFLIFCNSVSLFIVVLLIKRTIHIRLGM